MPSLKIELSPELAAQLESETLASGVSRAKVIKQILDSHYSKLPESPSNHQVIANEKDAQIRQLERMLDWMYQLNYVLVVQRLLPAPKKVSWWSSLYTRLLFWQKKDV